MKLQLKSIPWVAEVRWSKHGPSHHHPYGIRLCSSCENHLRTEIVRGSIEWTPFLTWQRHEDMKTEITSPLIWFEDTMESSETAGTLIVLLWIWVPAEPANSVENKSSLRRRKYNIKQIESGFPDSGKLKARFVTQGGLQTSSLASNLNAQKADRLYPWIANKIGENQHLFSKTVFFTSNF